MPFVVDDLQQAAADVALHLARFGYRFDFRPPSLWEVDRFFDEQGPRAGRVAASGRGTGGVVFGLGGYVGEVLRRGLGGDWEGDDTDAEAEINVQLRLGDGSIVWPVQRVMKRYQNGDEDAIVPYATELGLALGDPRRPAGLGFKLWAMATHDPSPSAARKARRWIATRRDSRG